MSNERDTLTRNYSNSERDTPTPNRSDSDRDTPMSNRSRPRPGNNKLSDDVLKAVHGHFKQ
ncbi:unnamed protein product [Acanthoscelides obtectus]|uniref:Uncharacterized protein n=1 Tax=Acanthoscelides obtectus TaxID=200917 RepID=A0A9P0MEE4_ACAOB|nr:unnamed protein product [Acanthoscelides obtectus]CAK1641060.1 hypothetical protein AOBTE_LOCUS12118 [Acanthoscelides obtectus]